MSHYAPPPPAPGSPEHVARFPEWYAAGLVDDESDSIAPGVGVDANLIGGCVITAALIAVAVVGLIVWATW